MQDDTLFDKPGIELDAEMAQQILDHGDRYGDQTAGIAEFIHRHTAEFRQYLLSHDLIQQASNGEDGFDLAAVDGASATNPHGGGALIAATAYKTTISDEKQRGTSRTILVPNSTELESLATLLRIHLELSLLASDKLDADRLVILDHTFWGVMQAVGRALATYKVHRNRLVESGRGIDTDAMLQVWRDVFRGCLGLGGSYLQMMLNKQVISLSKTGISQFFVNRLLDTRPTPDVQQLTIASTLNDRALLRHILMVGEYTTPQTLYHTIQEGGAIKSWKRGRFATQFEAMDGPDPFEARDRVFDEYGLPQDNGKEVSGKRLFITYYKPHAWSRVYRIEFHERMLFTKDQSRPFDLTGQSERFQKVLASVRQSVNPETKEPLSQVLADLRAKAATAAALAVLPERAFYQLRDKYRNSPDMLEIIDTLMAEERT